MLADDPAPRRIEVVAGEHPMLFACAVSGFGDRVSAAVEGVECSRQGTLFLRMQVLESPIPDGKPRFLRRMDGWNER